MVRAVSELLANDVSPTSLAAMTLNEAAAILGVTPDTLRQQLANGKLRGRKIGPIWTVTRREVELYAKHHRRKVT